MKASKLAPKIGKTMTALIQREDTTNELLANQQTSSLSFTKDVVLKRPPQNQTYTFIETVNVSPNIVSSTTLEQDYAFQFQLNNLQNVTAFTTIFDQYRIDAIWFRFVPTSGPIGSPLYTFIDYDDASLTTLASSQNYPTLKMSSPGAYFERTIVPKSAVAAYTVGSVFTGYELKSGRWLNCATPSVAHYGLKACLPASANPTSWSISYTIKFSLRYVK